MSYFDSLAAPVKLFLKFLVNMPQRLVNMPQRLFRWHRITPYDYFLYSNFFDVFMKLNGRCNLFIYVFQNSIIRFPTPCCRVAYTTTTVSNESKVCSYSITTIQKRFTVLVCFSIDWITVCMLFTVEKPLRNTACSLGWLDLNMSEDLFVITFENNW